MTLAPARAETGPDHATASLISSTTPRRWAAARRALAAGACALASTWACTGVASAAIVNGGFEADAGDGSAAGWTDVNSFFVYGRCDVFSCGTAAGTQAPSSGRYWILFGGDASAQAATLSQTLTLTASDQLLTFDFWAGLTTSVATSLQFAIDGNVLWSVDQNSASAYAAGYTQVALSTLGYNDGGSHTLSWSFANDAGNATVASWNLDNVALSVPAPGTLALVGLACTGLLRRRR